MFPVIIITILFLISVTLIMLGFRNMYKVYTAPRADYKLERKSVWLIISGSIVMFITLIIKFVFLP